jgi:hypothetical protein
MSPDTLVNNVDKPAIQFHKAGRVWVFIQPPQYKMGGTAHHWEGSIGVCIVSDRYLLNY